MSSKRKRRRQRIPRQPTPPPRAQNVPHPVEYASASVVARLTYSRRQAAEALGVSVTTIDRRVVPAINTVRTPWGQRLIPVDELERFVDEHLEPGRRRDTPRLAGRPPILPQAIVDRIRLDYARGRTLGEIARSLTAEGVPTAHGGTRWWPSTIRGVLLRVDAHS